MESNNIRNLITGMVEGFMPRFTDKNKIMLMKLRLSWTHYYLNDKELHYNRHFFIAIHRPNNYTKVMINEKDNHLTDEMEFELTADHDSCWRDDGFRFIFKAYCDAWDFFDEHDIEGREISPTVMFDLGKNPKFYSADVHYPENKYEKSTVIKNIKAL